MRGDRSSWRTRVRASFAHSAVRGNAPYADTSVTPNVTPNSPTMTAHDVMVFLGGMIVGMLAATIRLAIHYASPKGQKTLRTMIFPKAPSP